MKAIILAGGYATRLLPLTANTPKHLLPIAGKPMINYLMARLAKLDIDGMYLVTNHKFSTHFQEWAAQTPWDVTIIDDQTTSNDDRLGSLGDILYAVEKFEINDDLFIVGADNLTDFNFQEMLLRFKETGQPVVGVYDIKDKEIAQQFGVVGVDEQGKITSFEEKPQNPKSTLVSTLFYMLPKKSIHTIRTLVAHGKADKAGWLIQELMASTDVYTITHTGFWFDIGNKSQYEDAQKFYEDKS